MKLLENNKLNKILNYTPIFKYVGIIFTWLNLIYNSSQAYFFSFFEKKIGIEVLLLTINFLLIGLGQNSKKDRKNLNTSFFMVVFILFYTFLIIYSWHNPELLVSIIILLISNLIAFYTKSGEYGANGNDLFITGRGSIFCFVILAVYGIPIGLILKYFNLLNNISAIGYSIVGYYAILLFFEIKFIIKSINS